MSVPVLPPTAPAPRTPDPSGASRVWWRRGWFIAVAAAVPSLLVGIGIGAATKTDTETVAAGAPSTLAPATAAPSTTSAATTTPPTSTTERPTTTAATTVAPTTVTPTTAPAATTVPAPAAPAAPAPTAPPLPRFGAGTMLVHQDVQPGRYIAEPSPGCYWARLSGVSGGFDEILANENTDGQAIVDIAASDVAFDSSRCGTWTLYVPPPAPATTFGEGAWVVGAQIVPGRYRSSGATSCYWARLSGFLGGFDQLIANDNTEADAIVDIKATDKGFASSRCGTWSKVG